jgi:hypothetical protein
LAVSSTGGNRSDVTQLMPLIEKVPAVRGRRGRPRKRPDALYADRGHDHDKYRRLVRDKGIMPMIARRGVEHGSGLGVHRRVVEQSFALLHWFRHAVVPGNCALSSLRFPSARWCPLRSTFARRQVIPAGL